MATTDAISRQRQPARLWDLLAAALIAALAAAVFSRLARSGFLALDDPLYISANPLVTGGLCLAGVKQALASFHAGYWIPATWTFLSAEYGAFGSSPAGYHVVSIALHAGVSLLAYAFFAAASQSRPRALALAALFCAHPLAVEPVAWASGQKELLFSAFYLGGMLAYLSYAGRPGAGRYLLVTALFALSLASKPMAVTFPAVLLVLDFWPLGRLDRARAARLIAEKLPWFAMALAVSLLTIYAHRAFGALPEGPGPAARLANAVYAAGWYAAHVILPYGLAVFYPYPAAGIAWYKPLLAAAGLIAAGLWFLRLKGKPWFLAGLLFFLLTLAPASGLIQAGAQAMADRFAYLPRLGVLIILVMGAAAFLKRLRLTPPQMGIFAVVAVASYAAMAFIQTGYWRDRITLYSHALAVTEGNYIAENRLGRALVDIGEDREAMVHFRNAVKIAPSYAAARNNIAGQYMARGMYGAAQGELSYFLDKYPEKASPEIYNNLGAAAANNNDMEAALEYFEKAVRAFPDNLTVRYNLANAYFFTGKLDKAREEFEKALILSPGNPVILKRLKSLSGGNIKAEKPNDSP